MNINFRFLYSSDSSLNRVDGAGGEEGWAQLLHPQEHPLNRWQEQQVSIPLYHSVHYPGASPGGAGGGGDGEPPPRRSPHSHFPIDFDQIILPISFDKNSHPLWIRKGSSQVGLEVLASKHVARESVHQVKAWKGKGSSFCYLCHLLPVFYDFMKFSYIPSNYFLFSYFVNFFLQSGCRPEGVNKIFFFFLGGGPQNYRSFLVIYSYQASRPHCSNCFAPNDSCPCFRAEDLAACCALVTSILRTRSSSCGPAPRSQTGHTGDICISVSFECLDQA